MVIYTCWEEFKYIQHLGKMVLEAMLDNMVCHIINGSHIT